MSIEAVISRVSQLQAMLAAEGIRSYPVLIHSDRKLDPDVPSPAQFDHLITVASSGRTSPGWIRPLKWRPMG